MLIRGKCEKIRKELLTSYMLVPKEGGVVYYCKSLATVSHSAPSHYGNTLQIVTCMRKVDHVKTNVPYVEWGGRARQTSNLHDCESVGEN